MRRAGLGWVLLTALLSTAGCATDPVGAGPAAQRNTFGRAAAVDAGTGYLLAKGQSAPEKATVSVQRSLDLKRAGMLVVTSGGDYYRNQVRRLNVFERVIAEGELAREPEARPALKIAVFTVPRDGGEYLTLTVHDAREPAEVFRADVLMPRSTFDRSDQKVRYPLFNSLMDWLRANGATVTPESTLRVATVENLGTGLFPCVISTAKNCSARVMSVDGERVSQDRNSIEILPGEHTLILSCDFESTFGRRGVFVSTMSYRATLAPGGSYRLLIRRVKEGCEVGMFDDANNKYVGELLRASGP
jgi:hypothetical protein